MLAKVSCVFVLLLAVQDTCAATSPGKKDSTDLSKYNSFYYNPETGVGLMPSLEDNSRDPLSTKISFRGLPCECDGFECSCCAGVNMTLIDFNRRACIKFTFVPVDSAIRMTLNMNEREIYASTVSIKNPPPLCVPMPYLPFVGFCIRFFEMFMDGRNLHACIDLETRIVGTPILILHFNCVKVGVDGVSWAQIGNETNSTTVEMHAIIEEPEVYDDVDFEQQDLEAYANYTSTLSPEDEAEIGQLKL
ncbi:uncharacterized protein LOC116430211 [Nomia melanderi]|uniref:uncharacterized protein LOC116430211 n=1 Tax=Nomia melanderi TaxID=2448451 RepID=UPI001303F7CF|nr:uncharacterized protein LOC116430211 [Nomia melanderi]